MSSHPSISSRRCRAFACVAALVAIATFAACGGGNKKEPTVKGAVAKSHVPGSNVSLRVVLSHVETAGPSLSLDKATTSAVMGQTLAYVENAIVRPLLSGKPQAAFNTLWAADVGLAATHTADRSALTDEGVGKVNGDVRAPNTPVALTGLADSNGALLYVAANFKMQVRSSLAGQPLNINRTTELTFEKQANGKWLVIAYRVVAVRAAGKNTTTRTATSTTRKP